MCVVCLNITPWKILYITILSEQDKKIARSFCHQGLHKKDEMIVKWNFTLSVTWIARTTVSLLHIFFIRPWCRSKCGLSRSVKTIIPMNIKRCRYTGLIMKPQRKERHLFNSIVNLHQSSALLLYFYESRPTIFFIIHSVIL